MLTRKRRYPHHPHNIYTRKNSYRNNKSKSKSRKLMTDSSLFKWNAAGNEVYKHYREADDSTLNKDPKRCMCINYKNIDDFQTYDRCPNIALDGSDFCQLHQNCKSYLRQFLSGSEPQPDEEIWKDPLVEGSHNCYSYFLNRQVSAVREKCQDICNKRYKNVEKCINDSGCGDLKPQPGDFELIRRSGTDKGKERIYKCPNLHKKIIQDNPAIFATSFNSKCPAGYYKGAMTIEPDSTYHFYKQVADGTFYHKPGLNPVSKVDSPFKGENGRPIYVPHFANRDYSRNDGDDGINYTSFCSYYCIPQNNLVHKNLA